MTDPVRDAAYSAAILLESQACMTAVRDQYERCQIDRDILAREAERMAAAAVNLRTALGAR